MGLLAPNPRQNRLFCTQFAKETFASQPFLSQSEYKKDREDSSRDWELSFRILNGE